MDNGGVLISARKAAALHLRLHLHHGSSIADPVARRLAVPPHRVGGQAQFVAPGARPGRPRSPNGCPG